VGGPADGRLLDDVCRELGAGFVGTSGARLGRGGFPLLAKLIDTAEWLSVQVHPDDTQALELEGPPGIGKAESWLVLDAGPRAELLVGRRPGVTGGEVRAAIGAPELIERLQRIRPRAGDRVAVPAGLLHALGPELLVYELQQPSDITYRAWDWGRVGRELHVEQTRRVVDADRPGLVEGPVGDVPEAVVADAPFYRATQLRIAGGSVVVRSTDGTSPHAITVLDGSVTVGAAGGEARLERWGTAVLGAAAGRYEMRATGPATVLVATVP
jgi:mannose-6-phosphate isomerase